MVKQHLDQAAYNTDLTKANSAAKRLDGGNGLNAPQGSLSTNFPKQFQTKYADLTKAINAYADVISHDISRFSAAADNQVTLDNANGKR
ncbi:hypothetical protein [Latilactobacillus fuchuensis]|uniref:TIGR04197 family type VII secretion effector n=1 Tax=Latilactobacillus fuchuensis TaxID=164393 RepID=A0A2N9DV01_9LACO|nr:hypothetical protein [Latilactobacillus fuchuensis]SPC38266.1 hypothetical protein LFUMFP_220027 [Latilactobacillus fuchuensis]